MSTQKGKNAKQICPKTDRSRPKKEHRWIRWLFPVTGLLALIWFLVRVIPKPSRAAYPCQRIAMPLASGFVVWLLGLSGSVLAYRKARCLFHKSRYVAGGIGVFVAVMAIWWPLCITGQTATAVEHFEPTDLNVPIGVPKGIHPGRVVWIHDPNVTDCNGSGNWWLNTSQSVCTDMMSNAIQWLTGQSDDSAAWYALFRDFNRTHSNINVGYQPGEKIAIKLNLNACSTQGNPAGSTPFNTPQMVYALLTQLVNNAGVPAGEITVYDASRYVPGPIHDLFSAGILSDVRFVDCEGGSGRILVEPNMGDPNAAIYFGDPNVEDHGQTYMPNCVVNAKYLINMAMLKGHALAGVTLCAKNHFGSIYRTSSTGGWAKGWWPGGSDTSPGGMWGLHGYMNVLEYYNASTGMLLTPRPMGTYNSMVDLMGHEHLGGKTLLFIIDAIYGTVHQSGNVSKFESFGNDWCSSLFISQDGVAIDSVGLDFLRNESTCDIYVVDAVDNYLHEAALADDPCSGTFYNPEDDGVGLESLGVHEHWNNATDKHYSRNLHTGCGIELICSAPIETIPGDFEPDGDVDLSDLDFLAEHWLQSVLPCCDGDLNNDRYVDLLDFTIFAQNYGTMPGTPNEVGWWPFDEGAGVITIDYSGYDNDGTIARAAWADGKIGYALDFEGGDYVIIDAAALSSINQEVTIALWQYGDPDIQPQDDVIFRADDNEGRVLSIHIPWGDGNIYWDAGNDAVGDYDSIDKHCADANDYEGRWNHWAFTKNCYTGQMKIYLNGSLWHSGSGRTRAMDGITAFKIGSDIFSGTVNYDGVIDDVRVFDKELSVDDINDIYLEGL